MYKITIKELVDTFSSSLMNLSKGITLSHKVRFARSNLSGNREYFQKEFVYRSKYSDVQRVMTLRLDHSSYLCIEDKSNDEYESLIINTTNRGFIVSALKEFNKKLKHPELFCKINGKDVVNPTLLKESTVCFEAYSGKIIKLKPYLIEIEDKEPVDGISMCLNSKTMSNVIMSIDTFRTMLKLIKKFDFYMAGLSAVNILNTSTVGNYQHEYSSFNDQDTDIDPVIRPQQQNSVGISGLQTVVNTDNKYKGW